MDSIYTLNTFHMKAASRYDFNLPVVCLHGFKRTTKEIVKVCSCVCLLLEAAKEDILHNLNAITRVFTVIVSWFRSDHLRRWFGCSFMWSSTTQMQAEHPKFYWCVIAWWAVPCPFLLSAGNGWMKRR